MARGWHYAKLSLSNARRLPFSGMCILLFFFFSLCRFCLFVFFFCSHWSLVDVPLISFCRADHIPVWQPRTGIVLGMVEARSINVKKTTTTTSNFWCKYSSRSLVYIAHRNRRRLLSTLREEFVEKK